PGEQWHGAVSAGYGSSEASEGNFHVSGPLIQGKLGLSIAGRYEDRDGFTKNDTTGNTLDDREARFFKSQMQWAPADRLSVRFIFTNEHDHDGDYALGDLAAIRNRPFHVQRDSEGFVNRDVLAPTLIVRYMDPKFELTSTSGIVDWRTSEATDLDYSAVAAARRENRQNGTQITQELRLTSPQDHPVVVGNDLKLKWQVGAFGFSQRYEQDAVNHYAPFVLSPFIGFAVDQASSARLSDKGLGVYGHATLLIGDTIDVGAGLRGDRESKQAELVTSYSPVIAAATVVDESRSYSKLSPELNVAYHVDQNRMVYGSINRGYRAGGFNPTSPVGSEAYGEESSLSYEVGAKAELLDHRVSVHAAAFYVAWDNLQLNLPNGQSYYVANAGDAKSQGLELEVKAQLSEEFSVFSSFGYADARFRNGATSISTSASGTNSTVDVGGNKLVYAPELTYSAGVQFTKKLDRGLTVYARPELAGTGSYYYNAANTESQKSYVLVNARVGVEGQRWFTEGWVKNLFDTRYVPVAFEYPNNQSGFIGEVGSPLTLGIRTGFKF
ncbi:MAG: TonB-dependent receptor, partial [Planctomycetota bacterium]